MKPATPLFQDEAQVNASRLCARQGALRLARLSLSHTMRQGRVVQELSFSHLSTSQRSVTYNYTRLFHPRNLPKAKPLQMPGLRRGGENTLQPDGQTCHRRIPKSCLQRGRYEGGVYKHQLFHKTEHFRDGRQWSFRSSSTLRVVMVVC